MPTLATLGRTAVVSPHLDDAVFACGRLLAAHPGAQVITVFAGDPGPEVGPTDWDRRCGFTEGVAAMAARREEDRQALTLLEAQPVWLPFLDAQYRRPGAPPLAPAAVAQALKSALDPFAPQTVLFPLGLFHADHALVHQACLGALQDRIDLTLLAYEDALYRGLPGQVQQRLMALAQAGWQATPARFARHGAAAAKARAVRCYASQLRGFGEGGHDDLEAPERAWRLEHLPAGSDDDAS